MAFAGTTMSREFMTLDELVKLLGRDRRQVEKLVQRGVIPGRRIGGEWRFNDIGNQDPDRSACMWT